MLMIFHGVFHEHGLAFMINGMMISWPFWMLDPLKGGANFECRGKGNAARIRAAMSGVLDRCRAHLDLVGFGPREMATLDINDSGEIARQIAFELNITPSQELEDAIVEWIQEAREPARMAMRLEGILANDIEWSRLQTRRRFGPATAQEPAPPPGDKDKEARALGQRAASEGREAPGYVGQEAPRRATRELGSCPRKARREPRPFPCGRNDSGKDPC